MEKVRKRHARPQAVRMCAGKALEPPRITGLRFVSHMPGLLHRSNVPTTAGPRGVFTLTMLLLCNRDEAMISGLLNISFSNGQKL